MQKEIASTLCEKLEEDVFVMKNRLKTLDKALKNHNQIENAVAEFESRGYFILSFLPYFVLGKSIQEGDLKVRAIIRGYNGIPGAVRLEYTYVPREYTPKEVLRPPCQEENQYHIKSAKQAYVEYFKEKLCMGISFRDENFVFFKALL